MTNQIKWVKVFESNNLINYRGDVEETWEALIYYGSLIRHVYYYSNEGDISNRTETMVFVPSGVK